MGWYLCYFMHRHLDFRRAEFQALADLNGFGDAVEWRAPFGGVEHSPFHYVRLPSDDAARAIMKRSILTKGIVELWGEGNDQDELNAAIAAFDAETKARYTAEGSTFKVELEDFGKTLHGTRDDNWGPAVRRIDALKPAVEFNGRARMKGAEHLFWSIESAEGNDLRGIPSDIPSRHYFGRVVAASAARAAINTYDLKKRRYLGPTSMDVEMSLIMANMVHAGPGRVVWDPFCGTGSVLIAAAHFGAMTMGSDIDVRVIRWGKKDKRTGEHVDVWTNFKDYALPPPIALLRADLHKPPFRGAAASGAASERGACEGHLQGVVGDPPYGVRAGGRKSGGRKRLPDGTARAVPEQHRENHIPSTVPYPFHECMDDLMEQAARLLSVGGRLSFFVPAAADPEDAASAGVDSVPSHPMLTLRASSMQLLSTRWGRRLVTFEKTKKYDHEAAEEAKAALAEARKKGGNMEDLLERMRATVYHHGENVDDKDGEDGVGGGRGDAEDKKKKKKEKPKDGGKFARRRERRRRGVDGEGSTAPFEDSHPGLPGTRSRVIAHTSAAAAAASADSAGREIDAVEPTKDVVVDPEREEGATLEVGKPDDGGAVGELHRAHSGAGVRMGKASRPDFRGKNT